VIAAHAKRQVMTVGAYPYCISPCGTENIPPTILPLFYALVVSVNVGYGILFVELLNTRDFSVGKERFINYVMMFASHN
jgi:hypothetical protein